jgi:hypothetical protein
MTLRFMHEINFIEIDDLDNILKSYSSEDILRLQKNGVEIYNEFYTYNSCYKQILKKI